MPAAAAVVVIVALVVRAVLSRELAPLLAPTWWWRRYSQLQHARRRQLRSRARRRGIPRRCHLLVHPRVSGDFDISLWFNRFTLLLNSFVRKFATCLYCCIADFRIRFSFSKFRFTPISSAFVSLCDFSALLRSLLKILFRLRTCSKSFVLVISSSPNSFMCFLTHEYCRLKINGFLRHSISFVFSIPSGGTYLIFVLISTTHIFLCFSDSLYVKMSSFQFAFPLISKDNSLTWLRFGPAMLARIGCSSILLLLFSITILLSFSRPQWISLHQYFFEPFSVIISRHCCIPTCSSTIPWVLLYLLIISLAPSPARCSPQTRISSW